MVSLSDIKWYWRVLFLRVHITSGSPLQKEHNQLNSPKVIRKQKHLPLHLHCLCSSNPKPQKSRPLIYDHVSQNKNLDTIIMATVIFYKDKKKKRHSSSPINLFRIHSAGQSRSIHFYYAVGKPKFLSSRFWSKMMQIIQKISFV